MNYLQKSSFEAIKRASKLIRKGLGSRLGLGPGLGWGLGPRLGSGLGQRLGTGFGPGLHRSIEQ